MSSHWANLCRNLGAVCIGHFGPAGLADQTQHRSTNWELNGYSGGAAPVSVSLATDCAPGFKLGGSSGGQLDGTADHCVINFRDWPGDFDNAGLSVSFMYSGFTQTETSKASPIGSQSESNSMVYNFHDSATDRTRCWVRNNAGGRTRTINSSSNANVNDGNTHHVVYGYDYASDTGNLYWDGVVETSSEQSQSSGTFNDFAYSFSLGRQSGSSNSQYFPGYLDCFAFWNREITAAEVASIYAALFANGQRASRDPVTRHGRGRFLHTGHTM
jgi:hypothetical protein